MVKVHTLLFGAALYCAVGVFYQWLVPNYVPNLSWGVLYNSVVGIILYFIDRKYGQ